VTGRRIAALVLFDLVAVAIIAALVALSAWQFQRRTWKLDLIERIEARVNAPAVPAPGPDRWAGISAATDEYRRVEATGQWLDERAALVLAVTEHGGGYWVLAPFRRDDGTTVYVNRGFVPADSRDPASWRALPRQTVTVTGLLRLTEPRGTVLQSNDPAADRWYSRDVQAIAGSRGLGTVAPYFIDAERRPGEEGIPIGGLTVLKFTNNHLVYALTWAALAAMAAAGAVFVHVDALRRQKRPA
jgi:surfeit locus 1 family protein